MAFTNSITGGQGTLVRPAIKSPDYVAGVSGWSINKDGTVEFNSGTFRGTITASSFVTGTSGRRIEINVAGSQSMVLYDASNKVLMTVGDQAGAITSFPSGATNNALLLGGAQFQFLWASAGIYTPMAWFENNATSVILNTQLTGGIAFDAPNAALSYVTAGSTTLETWQTPSYATNWLDSTTFNGLTGLGPLRYRRDAENNVHFSGCFKAGAVAPGQTITTLPVGYRPQRTEPLWVQRNNGGTLTGGYATVSAAGVVSLQTATGLAAVANNEFLVQGIIPRMNLA